MFNPEVFIPLIAVVSTFGIPIVVILTRHQRKMTELLHQNSLPPQQTGFELQSIQYEVQQLKSMVATLAMSVDSLKEEVRNGNSIQDRINIEN